MWKATVRVSLRKQPVDKKVRETIKVRAIRVIFMILVVFVFCWVNVGIS